MAGLMLGVFLLLNAAAVAPVWHHLWHDGHECDQPDCVVLAVARGSIESGPDPVRWVRPSDLPVTVELLPESRTVVGGDRLLPSGRAPPV